MLTKAALAAIGAAALIIPGAAAAQQYYAPAYAQPYYGQSYAQPYYAQYNGQPRGDYGRGDYDNGWRRGFNGYPEFRGLEDHIRSEIREGVRDGLIEPEDGRDLFGQLRDIQGREAREFRVHGWSLPDDDRYSLRSQLQQLDRLVDQIRAEPEG